MSVIQTIVTLTIQRAICQAQPFQMLFHIGMLGMFSI
jgi:hypothetical protein